MLFPIFKPGQATGSADFKAGAMFLIDKPKGWTSFDVVNKIRSRLKHLLNVKKIKVGHSGTLDPMATGLLILCSGKATKTLQNLQGLDKVYSGTFFIGATTPSYDMETEINETFPTDHIDKTHIEAARQALTGAIDQLPPIFSAIKVDGQPLYVKARKGIQVEVKPRPVVIRDFDILSEELDNMAFRVTCSKGTYIRSLAYDFGKAMGSGAYLSALVRESIGQYKLSDAWNLEELVAHLEDVSE